MIYLQPEINRSYLQAAFSVSSKSFKKAIQRNRIKRLMREAYRLQKEPLLKGLENRQKKLIVFIIYTGSTLPEFDYIFEKMNGALNELRRIILTQLPT
jgi:ribonuclease P protein component